ncbi:YcnI family copper-binding membrane protein [Amphritea sp. HPY]|uniref:YcnI family copper-binding membrane protein n=1 Tax=Amphritea sp. HPY TaxID=3421652 RepID=UPI003D7CA189
MKPLLPVVLLAAAAISCGFSTAAVAHASLETQSAAVDSHYKGVMKIGHGCKGSPTQTVRILLPLEIRKAKPMPKAGWTLETVKKTLDEPFDYYGKTVTEDVREIIWSGGNLSDDFFDEFVFSAKLAGEPGQTLYVNTIQECPDGENRWTEIPEEGQDSHDLKSPAPVLQLTEKHHNH